MAILNIGSRGLIERGFLCPLLEYAVRNGIQAEALTMSCLTLLYNLKLAYNALI